ncbi:rod shape-determining protein MreC [Demetria terragena]|uniref:rod shape-determining protein MreC n=1 Tax=Demetria terragena TaxID=63959 RepID=UPI00037F3B62|nr:rod shape-determining protein MreC [Demetria terragena]
MPLSQRSRRRLVIGGVVVSVFAWGVDTVVPRAGDAVREGAATVVEPIQERLTLSARGDTKKLRAQRDQARRALTEHGDRRSVRDDLRRLLGSAAVADRQVIPARVVAFTPPGAAGGSQRVTIDVGARDGITDQQTVVAAQGLVGRTVTVRANSTDVEVLTSPGAVVGARVERSGSMGSLVATPPPAVPRRTAGELTLSFVADGDVRTGDTVRTLGSIGERPYVRDVVLGRVTGVDPDRGQLGRTARVRPVVDTSALDVVAVVQPVERTLPRPAATGTGTR